MSHENKLDLELDTLEPRQMMAGDVSVSVVNGDLIINGDNQGNELMIIGTGVEGQFDIIGANGTAINGFSALMVDDVTDDVRINLRNGNNSLGVSGVVAKDRFRVRTGSGADTIVFEQSGSKNQLDIITGAGDDSVYLYRSGSKRINARTAAGDDELAFDQAQTFFLTVTAGGGEDEMYLGDTTIVERARVNMGGGADEFVFAPSIMFGADLRISGGGGADAFEGNNIPFVSFEVTGVGVDSLSHFIDFGSGQIESRIDLS